MNITANARVFLVLRRLGLSACILSCQRPEATVRSAVQVSLAVNPTKSIDWTKVNAPAFPDSIASELVDSHEGRDEQVIAIALPMSAPLAKSANVAFVTAGFRVVTRAAWGQVSPAKALGKPQKYFEDQESKNKGTAVVVLRMSDDVDAFPKGTSEIFLHYKAGTWSATLGSFTGTPLFVTRYIYKKHDAVEAITLLDSFPETTRFDWSDDATPRLLIGVPCDAGWCMIGTASSQMDAEDPFDVSTEKWPVQRRVRGWYDRKQDATTGIWAYIFPDAPIGKLSKSEFKKQLVPVVSVDAPLGTTISKVIVSWLANEVDDFEAYASGRGVKMYKWEEHAGKVPGAARWSTGIYARRDIDHPVTFLSATGTPLAAGEILDLDEMWVRCANGCCQATFQ